ncbi:hypothetical protein GCM10009789_69130 [Kribbella sancticallisti]|uniref:DUF3592 domain-containing protein n=1 Tax=Kribbella sancticallisti TaxID=460087 RepID=A0ABN2EEJ8_9ACTN
MARIRSMLNWIFVRGPAAFYELAESGSWLFTLGTLGGMAVAAGLGAGVGALVGLLAGTSVSAAADTGFMIGLFSLLAWMVMSGVVVAVLWIRGIAPGALATDHESPRGRHAVKAEHGWRRPGEPLVPGSLVAFFGLMVVIFGSLGVKAWHDSRPWDEPTAVVDGAVVEVEEPGWIDKGAGSVLVRYVVAAKDHVIEIDRDPGEHFLRLDDRLPVEYAVARPARARAVWEVESAREDRTGWAVMTGLCGVLGAASGVGYLVGRRKRR